MYINVQYITIISNHQEHSRTIVHHQVSGGNLGGRHPFIPPYSHWPHGRDESLQLAGLPVLLGNLSAKKNHRILAEFWWLQWYPPVDEPKLAKHPYGGFYKWGYPIKWMVYRGKSYEQMDDFGVPPWMETPIWLCCPNPSAPSLGNKENPPAAASGREVWALLFSRLLLISAFSGREGYQRRTFRLEPHCRIWYVQLHLALKSSWIWIDRCSHLISYHLHHAALVMEWQAYKRSAFKVGNQFSLNFAKQHYSFSWLPWVLGCFQPFICKMDYVRSHILNIHTLFQLYEQFF